MTRLKRRKYERLYRLQNKVRLRKYRQQYEKKYKKRIAIYREKYKLLWRKRHPIRFLRGNRNRALQIKFGINHGQYITILKKQQYKCAICPITNIQNKRDLAVDHCHKTNRIRGLLCNQCNVGLGMFRDNKKYLRKAVQYLCN